jgi:carbon-monoxide dehydrogenase small subunit
MQVRLRVNGEEHQVEAPAPRLLLDTLRYELGLTGSKLGCGVGVCGACTVLVDGQMVSSCLYLTALADGKEITTIEGLAQGDALTPIQRGFLQYGGFQCGICTPGQIMAAHALLQENPHPTEPEIKRWMMGNLCRCTGYYKIIESIQRTAAGEVTL